MLLYRKLKPLIAMVSTSTLAVSFLVACSGGGDESPTGTNPTAMTTEYSFSLNSQQVPAIPAVVSNASGTATLTLDKVSGAISGFITLSSSITATVAHIHKGSVGTSGAVVVTLVQDAGDSQRFNIPTNTVLLSTQVDELVGGNYYINVHSATNPTGELRGQILEANQSVLVTELSTQQLPTLTTVTSAGTARGFLNIDNSNGDISGVVRLSGINPTAMHIHAGYLGASGAPVITLAQSSDPNVWEIPASSNLTGSQLLDLDNGKLYFNIHTTANTAGELHGQITPTNIQLYVVSLAANNGVTTTAQGAAFVTLNTDSGLLNATVRTSGITITNMHIHDNNNAGAVVKGLMASTDPTIWGITDATLTADEITSMTNGAYYVNVHSSMNPTGELSGIIQ